MSHEFLRPPRRAPHAELSAAPPAQARRDTPQPLPPALRSTAEQRFGADFSAVRIHAGPAAATAARALDAAAYTVGRDIHFGARRWQPQQAAGQRLLAHELAHVVQQSRPGPAAGDAEARADAAATQVLHGRQADAGVLGSALGEIYEAVDRAKAGGKPLPRMALELGYKPTAPEDSQPPGGLPAVDKLGVDFSWRF